MSFLLKYLDQVAFTEVGYPYGKFHSIDDFLKFGDVLETDVFHGFKSLLAFEF